MRMQMVRIGAVASAAFAMAPFGTAVFGTAMAAAAPDVVGQTYSDAVKAIEDDGGSAVVAARVGDELEQDDCIVTNAWDGSFLRIDSAADSEIQLALNCAGGYATATNPGASVASPLGRAAKTKAEEEAAKAEEQQLAEAATPHE
jgi:hypothetical protein